MNKNETWKYFRDGKISDTCLTYEQYYCKPEIAKHLLSLVDLSTYDHIIEPCAGNGSFSLQIPGCEAYDIDPRHPSIMKANFYDLSFTYDPQKTLVIGGPPFGKDSEYAFKFMRHAIKFANTVAFILPFTFKEKFHRDKGANY